MKNRKQLFDEACRNNYGYYEVSAGTDMASRLNVSESTIRRYIAVGWLRKVGLGLVLTRDGYNQTED
jgi:hypothetical protein